MTHQLYNTYIFDDEHETLQDWTICPADGPNVTPHNTNLQNQSIDNTYWKPLEDFQNLYNKFQDNILAQ
ncbi:17761_t:CDS:1, partial [Dentiscutata erythropus]